MDKAENQDLRTKIAHVVQHIPGGALLFAVGSLIVLGYFGWYYYGADHLDQTFYSLRLEKLVVTPQPAWIKTPVAEEVFHNGRLDRISLLDPRATAAVAQAFETHHWVKTASRVSKSVGNRVDVDLVYRRPAAMVLYEKHNSDSDPNDVKLFFYPIDEEGTVLPATDFSSDDVWNYFMIFARDARPAGEVGMPYGDVRITEALRLCEFLQTQRDAYQLQEVTVQHDDLASGTSPWSLTIDTRDRTRKIIWGHAPHAEGTGELPADEKLRRMVAWLKQPLPTSPGEVHRIDLRSSTSATTTTPVSRRQ
ncbi:MAG: hypothetical protein ABI557_02705 [Aureliella sp.]